MDDDEIEAFEAEQDRLPEVGGAIGGCDCEMCAEMRREYHAAQPVAPVPVVGSKAVKAKRVPKKRDPNVSLNDIKLLPPSKVTLDRAVAMLRDPAMLEQVRDARNISHWAMVGPLHADVQMDMICHADASNNIQKGSNVWSSNGGQMYRHRIKPGDRYVYEYWDDVKNVWTTDYVTLTKPVGKKRAFYNYRYMVNWTNDRVKPEYHGEGLDYTTVQRKALTEFLWWLRNKSPWSRFFVGPTDRKTLFNCGCILDLSAPSCVVHMAAVAWRISGEYVEFVEQWWAMVQKGIDPVFAFGMAQNVTGFERTADPDAEIEEFYSKGHNIIGRSNIEQLARFTSGMLYISDKSKALRPARKYYSTSSNFAYCGGDADEDCDEDDPSGNWLAEFPNELKVKTEKPNPFNAKAPRVTYSIKASLFHSQWDKGWVWVLGEVGKYMAKRGWKGYGQNNS